MMDILLCSKEHEEGAKVIRSEVKTKVLDTIFFKYLLNGYIGPE